MKLITILISLLVYGLLIGVIDSKVKSGWLQAIFLILNFLWVIYASYLINIFL